MAADTNPQGSTDPNIKTHARDYAGFVNLLKWSILAVAIIAATVLYIISH